MTWRGMKKVSSLKANHLQLALSLTGSDILHILDDLPAVLLSGLPDSVIKRSLAIQTAISQQEDHPGCVIKLQAIDMREYDPCTHLLLPHG